MTWNTDMSAAPRVGEFQAWCVSRGNLDGWWEPRAQYNEHGAFELWGRIDDYDYDGWDSYSNITPTAWMPLPQPPEQLT